MPVYIGVIEELEKIKDADNILRAKVVCGRGGLWHGVVQKDQFKIGDLCEVYLPDTILPDEDRFLFMKKFDSIVRPVVIKGVVSEVLIMPLTVEGRIGQEISADVGAKRYVKQDSFSSGKRMDFPPFIPKTDEPDVQTVSFMLEELRDLPYYVTEKVDGTSCTVYYYYGHFGVCSRNYEIEEASENALWKLAREYMLEENLKSLNGYYAFQFEVAGPKINKNPLGLEVNKPFLFNVYDIEQRKYVNFNKMCEIARLVNFPMVKIVDSGNAFNYTVSELLALSCGYYDNGVQREGIVVRPRVEKRVKGRRLSFKVRNPYYER